MSRLSVPKTYKLYVGGAFPRSESGRTYEVTTPKGAFLANAAQASRKDARDAVVAARAAQSGWAGATAYNRGQVLYRVAEVLEGRREQFVAEIRASEATGVVAIVAPQGVANGSLRGLVAAVAPALVAGNTVVVIADERRPLSAISLAEVLATSDLPGGVVNVLTGSPAEMLPHLAAHADVNALDLLGAGALEWVDAEIAAAETLTRVLRPEPGLPALSLERVLAFTETKTVWHTKSVI